MNLFLLRHAKACARGPKWQPDDTRPLTRDGEKKMFNVARGIQSLDVSIDLIVTSPYLRAFRTAEILGEVFESKKLFETRNLIAEAEPKEVIDEINENFSELADIVLVGHEPFMTRLISVLLSGREDLSIELRKGGFCKLSVKKLSFGRCACLEWLMTPRQLARLARGKH
ncbi:MAG: phosphohistidine phosphatase SixA [Verrucomicrobiota bacterium]|jgi:phosphohistidine phosphatase